MRDDSSFHHGESDRLEVKSGGGCLMLFGLPFFGMGLFVMSVPFWQEGGAGAGLVAVPFGFIFAAVGAGIMFGRAGLIIDTRARTATRWWGLLVPFKRTTVPLDDIDAVTISREVRRSKNSTYTVYPVRLRAKGTDLDVKEQRDYEAARREGERFAKFLGVKMIDSGSGDTVVREAGTLDESLRDRLAREGRPAERPTEPAACRVTTQVAGTEATFEIPPRGFGIGDGIAVAALGIFLTVALGFFASIGGGALNEDTPLPLIAFVAVFALFFLGIPLIGLVGVISSTRARDRVTASPRELRLVRKMLLTTKTTTIPTDELEELRIGGATRRMSTARGEVIIARSDRASIEIGAGLKPEELKWLHDVIKFLVTA
jgi:hypothetical protein